MSTETETGSTSEVTARAVAFVASRRERAEEVGTGLAEIVNDPEAFTAVLARALEQLADPEYLAGQRRVAPGIGPLYGVRWPLLAAVGRGFRAATRQEPPAPLLFVVDRLFHETHLEPRWFAFGLLERTLEPDPERTWQLLRRAAREASDWITVDSLAHPYASGIVAEPYRWAELEQLVFSSSTWERRLVGSTIATMTHGRRRAGRDPDVVGRSLDLLGQLMGDAEPDVQKALAWAYRSLAQVDLDAATAALEHQADLAAAGRDGHRAWVVRDSLSKVDADDAAAMRALLGRIRRRSSAGATSAAAAVAARFGSPPDPAQHPRPPLERGPTAKTIAVSQRPGR